MNELHMLPNNIVLTDIGHVINLSNVFRIDSHGNTMGPIEVEVKKIIIPIIPDIKYIDCTFLPSVKAINKMIGNKMPCIKTGGLL